MIGLPKKIKNSNPSNNPDVLSLLANMPRKDIPTANFSLIKNQILDRVYLPGPIENQEGWIAYINSMIPRMLKISGGLIGTFLILVSLALGTAVAALESIPGQSIYPLKKIVENVQLKLANSDDEQAQLQIKFTDHRLQELEKVLEKNKQGKLSDEKAQQIVASSVENLKKSTTAAVSASTKAKSTPQKVALLNTLVEQSAVLKSASIENEGEVKLELEKALESTRISQEEAIANIERAGLKVEAKPIQVEEETVNKVTANGKLTVVSETSLSIGTTKFLLTKDTAYINKQLKELKLGDTVEIIGEVQDAKTYATKVTAHIEPKIETKPLPENTETQELQ